MLVMLLEQSRAFEEEWQNHIGKNKMKFQSDQEYQHRKKLFKTSHDKIEAHNSKRGNTKLAHNKFSTMTNEEKASHYGYIPAKEVASQPNALSVHLRENERALPTGVDLRGDKCMGAIKYQNSCGSCWTFAATAVLEFNNCVKTGSLSTLSEQQIVDCIGRDGCQGGNPVEAWNYIVNTGGQDTSSSYPYNGTFGSCKFSSSQVGATISPKYAVTRIPSGDVNTAMAYLANRTALSASLDYVSFEFEHYQKGTVFTGPCSGQYGHAIAIVGYGTSTDGTDYWLIRNSWDTWWGDSGYAMVKRGVNFCGIESNMATTTASTGDPVQKVNWNSGPGGFYNYSNCGYVTGNLISTSTLSPLTLDDCGNRCVATSTCNYFTFSQSTCTFLTFSSSSFKPISYPDSSLTCGSVINRWAINWTTEGQLQFSSNCEFQEIGSYSYYTFSGAMSLSDCKNYCLTTYPSYCNHFTLSSTGVCTMKLSQVGSKPTPIYSSANSNCGWVPTRL